MILGTLLWRGRPRLTSRIVRSVEHVHVRVSLRLGSGWQIETELSREQTGGALTLLLLLLLLLLQLHASLGLRLCSLTLKNGVLLEGSILLETILSRLALRHGCVLSLSWLPVLCCKVVHLRRHGVVACGNNLLALVLDAQRFVLLVHKGCKV